MSNKKAIESSLNLIAVTPSLHRDAIRYAAELIMKQAYEETDPEKLSDLVNKHKMLCDFLPLCTTYINRLHETPADESGSVDSDE